MATVAEVRSAIDEGSKHLGAVEAGAQHIYDETQGNFEAAGGEIEKIGSALLSMADDVEKGATGAGIIKTNVENVGKGYDATFKDATHQLVVDNRTHRQSAVESLSGNDGAERQMVSLADILRTVGKTVMGSGERLSDEGSKAIVATHNKTEETAKETVQLQERLTDYRSTL